MLFSTKTIQKVPLNVITLEPSITDNINQMITISKCITKVMSESGLGHFDHKNQMITLTMITFRGFHCTKENHWLKDNIVGGGNG